MRAYLLPALFQFVLASVQAQCPGFVITDLHTLQRASMDSKESTILSLGFDLRTQFVTHKETIRSYSKCWNSNYQGKAVFEQLVWWNVTTNAVYFMTLDETHFKQLRSSIVNRSNSKRVTENPDFYIGRMFHYNFGTRQLDNAEYYYIKIRFRQ